MGWSSFRTTHSDEHHVFFYFSLSGILDGGAAFLYSVAIYIFFSIEEENNEIEK